MSTSRRRLGTGPVTTRSTLSAESAPRLLAAERVGPDVLLEEAEHQGVTADWKGRRPLGSGAAGQ